MVDAVNARDVVLVVDDSPETLGFLTEALEQSGATVLVATDGSQALAIAERITPDIVLMDAVMPGMDGFEATRRMKRNASLAQVPVIFMTGLSETEHIVEGLESGGVDYITKPIVLEELLARIRVHLTNARTARSARLALDTAGRTLLAASRDGKVLWCTPQAAKLIEQVVADWDGSMLPEPLRAWLGGRTDAQPPAPPTIPTGSDRRLHFSLLSAADDEILFRISIDGSDEQASILRRVYTVTSREAEVLLWVAQGKSNRDIGAILGLSPRTVNKHLEQIYQKLGVENRASAAIAAVKALDEYG